MRIVRAIVFNPESVEIQYMDSDEVRLDGFVFQTRQITIARDREWDEEIAVVEEGVQDLLVDVLEDFAGSLPYDPGRQIQPSDDDDDDDD